MAITGSAALSGSYYSELFAGSDKQASAYDADTVLCFGSINYIRGMVNTCDTMFFGITQSLTEGSPSVPCLKIEGKNSYKLRWSVDSGYHSMSVDVKQARNINSGTRPSLYIQANPSIGIYDDIETYASSGSQGWVTIGFVGITASSAGGLVVEIRNNSNDFSDNPTYVDNIRGG